MPKPSFLDGPFGYHSESGIYDVADVIARIGILLTGVGWTEVSTGRYRSPARGGSLNKFIDVAVTRYAQGTMNFQVYDMLIRGAGLRSMNIQTTGVGSAMHYFYSPRHICVACQTSAEVAFAALLDPAPQAEDANIWCSTIMNASRASNGGSESYSPPSCAGGFGSNNPTSSYTLNTSYVFWGARNLRTAKMDYMFWPYEYGGIDWWVGRFPHCLICAGTDFFPAYANFQAPLGDGTNGIFKPVTGGTSWQIAFRIF